MAKSLYGIILLLLMMHSSWLKAQSPAMTVQISTTPSCHFDGTAQFTLTGGTAPYSYSIGNISGNSNVTEFGLTGLFQGNYSIYIADANGQSINQPFTVPSVLNGSSSVTPETCHADGSVSEVMTGGTTPYSFKWYVGDDNGNETITYTNGPSITGLSGSNWISVFVQDANGCNFFDSLIAVPSNYIVQTTVTTTNPLCNSPTSSTVSAIGGQQPYTYYWNTSPVQTTATATGLQQGNYTVTVTDANGCTGKNSVAITSMTYLGLTVTSSNSQNCITPTGTASVSVANGQPPYTYSWNNGSTSPTINNLSEGSYLVTVKDANGCVSSASTQITDANDIALYFNQINATCTQGQGSVTVEVFSGTPPFTYSWTNGATTSTISNLNWGNYNVTVTDALGCSVTKGTSISQDYTCTNAIITGTVFNDINGNCLQDAGENGVANTLVSLSSGYTTNTDGNGVYQFEVVPGLYTITHTPPANWGNICPASGSAITVNASVIGNTYGGNNFGDQVKPGIQDIAIRLWCFNLVSGRSGIEELNYINNGSVPVSGTIYYTHSNNLNFEFSKPAADNYNINTQTLEWNFTNLNPGEERMIELFFDSPTAPLGTIFKATGYITPVTGDAFPLNNYDTCSSILVGSYDPNELLVTPQGTTEQGYISTADSVLNYMIKFQNTGTDTAYTVVVTDTLSEYLDPLSVNNISASSNVAVNVKNGILSFTLDDINLLDSITDAVNSIGYVSFSVRVKKTTLPGSVIYNKANVYFDYNSPVPTNSVKNTLKTSVTTSVQKEETMNTLEVYPNPTNNKLNVLYTLPSDAVVAVKLYSVIGEEITIFENIQQISGVHHLVIETKKYGLTAGVYILKLYTNVQVQYLKIIIND
ncbi:MAG TPA: SdrD B-like domain-containing protein [Cytophagaceae bacterium]|nr:SdrD B-like domain-containing protein [Cytophagaceae bacterium]